MFSEFGVFVFQEFRLWEREQSVEDGGCGDVVVVLIPRTEIETKN